jgi:hypothetical protein
VMGHDSGLASLPGGNDGNEDYDTNPRHLALAENGGLALSASENIQH